MKHYLICPVLLALASGCSDGGGSAEGTGGGPDETPVIPTVTFADLTRTGNDLAGRAAQLHALEGITVDLPSSGTASYAGIAEFAGFKGPPSIRGTTELVVDFADPSLSGSIGNLRGDSGEYAGTLAITNADMPGTDGWLSGRVDGQLLGPGENPTAFDVVGDVNVEFVGDNAAYLQGYVKTDWIREGFPIGFPWTTMSGSIVAERQR